jgi:hypothetical protein
MIGKYIHYKLKYFSDDYSPMAFDTVEPGRWLPSSKQEMKVEYSSEILVTA